MTTTFERVLENGGESGALIAAIDWSQHPLGPIERWPQSLRTALSICLVSRTPILVWWGRELFEFYNDAYRPVLGASKHPRAMGARGAEIWPEIWHIMQPIFDGVLAGGPAVGHENMFMFLDRYGFAEETYFNHAHGPILGEAGEVAGVFTTVTETTSAVLGDRRLRTLKALGERVASATEQSEVCARAAALLAENQPDVPYCLVYRVDAERLERSGAAGLSAETRERVAPRELSVSGADLRWPLARVITTREPLLVDCELEFVPNPQSRSEQRRSPRQAFVMPAGVTAQGAVEAILIVGISPHLELDRRYRDFLVLAAGELAAALARARAHEEQQRRLQALEELDRAKTAFFSNVSHEFRTPLTLMLGPIEDALAGSQTLGGDSLAVVHRNALRLLRLVNMLLDFSRIEAGRLQASYVASDLAKLTVDFASGFESAFERAGLALEIDCPPLPELVYVDRDMWEKIVLNLLSNALKFTFEGRVSVSLRARDGHAELSVRDTGTGISRDELPRLFQRFHRIPNARARSHEGTGIGLALSHDLVELQGGTLSVDGELGRGSAFTVSLPFGAAHLPKERIGPLVWHEPLDAPALRRDPEPSGPPSATGLQLTAAAEAAAARVLIVDDNDDMRDYLARILGERYELITAENGAQALALAREHNPDLVLSDVMMPELDGFGLLRELRATSATRAIPIVLLSARAGEESRIEGLEAGADDYMVKPFSARELLARVETHVALGRARAEALRARFEAEAANRTKDEFLAMLGHELRNPLAPIATALMLMRERSDSVPSKERMIIERQVGHLTRLVDDLLDVSRIARGKVELHRERVNIAQAVRQAVEVAQPLIVEREQQLTLEVPPQGLEVIGDFTRIAQVLSNLLTNAAKYTDRKGQIAVHATRDNDAIVVRVRDDGIGIEPAMLPHVFDAFTQEGPERERSRGGLGLGLTIVRNLVAMHGGSISAHSEGKQRGSEFVLRLPAAAAGEVAQQAREPTSSSGVEAPLRDRKILIVDDDSDAAELLADWFRRKGAEARTALDGPAGLQLAIEYGADLGVIDIGLPGMSGYELAKRLRAAPGQKHLLLIAVTGFSQERDRMRSAEAGFDAHLVKPLDLSQFEPLLLEWLGRGA